MLSRARWTPVLLVAAAAACRRGEAPSEAPASHAAIELRPSVALVPGLKLTIVPYLPDVDLSDVPWNARRRVEVLAFDGKKLKVKWTGQVRVERPDSSHRREGWVRERANAPAKATPAPEPAAVYDDKEVSGTLEFSDLSSARGLLLPALWPEGNVSLAGASGIWLDPGARRELRQERRSEIPFFPASPLVSDPAADLLHRASAYVKAHEVGVDVPPQADVWRLMEAPARLAVTINGLPTTVPTLTASSWFGQFEILDEGELPLVLAVRPDPPSSAVLDLFAPARVLKTLLGYRVSAIDLPPRPKKAR